MVPAAGAAQQAPPAATAGPVTVPSALPYPAISVTATAAREFVPDVVIVGVHLEAAGPTAVAALAALRTKEQAARSAIAPAAGIVSGLVNQYEPSSNKGGAARVTMSEALITHVDLARAGATADALRRFDPNLLIAFDTTQREQLYREALAEATSIAVGRATAIAAASKSEIDRVTFVEAPAGAQAIDTQNLVLERLQQGALAGLAAQLGGQPVQATIRATVIVTVRVR